MHRIQQHLLVLQALGPGPHAVLGCRGPTGGIVSPALVQRGSATSPLEADGEDIISPASLVWGLCRNFPSSVIDSTCSLHHSPREAVSQCSEPCQQEALLSGRSFCAGGGEVPMSSPCHLWSKACPCSLFLCYQSP